MMALNYRCTKDLLDACQARGTRLIYASSAAVYGGSTVFREAPEHERPLNVYGYSKLLTDQVVRRMLPAASAQVVGLRYFNVYGPHEQHKGRMASVAFHHSAAVPGRRARAPVRRLWRLWPGPAGARLHPRRRRRGGQPVVPAHGGAKGVFNVGTGRAQPFNDVAHAVVNAWRARAGEARAAAASSWWRRASSSTSTSRRRWSASTSASRRPISARCATPAAITASSTSPAASSAT